MTIISCLLFILFTLLVVSSIGRFALNYLKIKLHFWEAIVIGMNVGIVLLVLLDYSLGVLGLEKIFYVFLPLVIIFLLIRSKFSQKWNIKMLSVLDYKLVGILLAAVIASGYFTYFSGLDSNGRLKLIGGNSHDGLWHLALINSLKKSVPPENPIYANTKVQNYHYLTDIFVVISSKFTNISEIDLYFKIIEPFFIILFSSTAFLLISKLTNNKFFSYFGVLFIVLSGNLFYIAKLFYPSAYSNPSVFWVDEFVTKMVNPQLLFSYIVILTILYLILVYEKISNYNFVFLVSILGASLLGIKSYGFVIILLSLFLLILFQVIKTEYEFIKLTLGLAFAGLVFYLTSNISKGSIFILSPLWFIKSMFETPDHLAYSVWELKRQTYLQHNNYLRIGQLYLEGLILFILGNLGGRLIGIFAILDKLDKRKKTVVYLLSFISIVSIVLPLVFIQKGVAWNSIQFFYYAVLALGILTIITLHNIYKHYKKIGIILAALIWFSLLPGIFYQATQYNPNQAQEFVSLGVLNGLNFLKGQPGGVVLLSPNFAQDSLVPAITGKTAFLADETILSIQLIDFNARKMEMESFFGDMNLDSKENFLKREGIKYIFLENNERSSLFENKFGNAGRLKINKIYSNREIVIYYVQNNKY